MARQGKIFLFGVVLYFFIRSSLIGSQDVEGESFIQVAFHKLEGNSLQTITVRSLLHCGMRCERVPECLSFNIAVVATNNGLYECVLLKNDTSESSDYLVPSQEYHHYTRFVPDPCSVPRCKNGGTCQTIGKDFLCHCPQGVTGKLCDKCINSTALGMESGDIPDSSINASNYLDANTLPRYARLHGTKCWAPKVYDTNQWLQVDLGTVAIVTNIATQGWPARDNWVKTYSLQYGLNSSYFEDYEGGKTLTGNNDKNTVVKNALQPAITARYIRVIPKTWQHYTMLRVELYGCEQGNKK